jgi:transketolase
VLAHFGYLEVNELSTFGQFKTRLGCHADRHKVPGVEASTGSLGHGIGLAVGMALAEKIKGSKKKIVCLIGDGEANEGSVWEAMLVASDNRLDNLTIVCDSNGSQVRCLNITNLDEKMRSFGADTYEVDGHNLDEIQNALMSSQDTVKCINARTKKGYGLKTLEENFLEWHRKSPDLNAFEEMMAEFNA